MFRRIIYRLIRFVESNPYTWWISWAIANRCTFLLPHDKSYFAIRHVTVSNGLLVDVGANTGISALSFLRLEPTLKVLSLEPNSIHERVLQGLKRRLGPRFDFRLLAVGERPGELEIVTPVYRWIALHTFTASNEQRVRDGVRRVFGSRVEQRCRYLHSRAAVVRLDDLEINPAVIKIDAEGFDLQVLLGARGTLVRSRPFVFVEIVGQAHDFVELFDELSYELFVYDYGSDSFELIDPRDCGVSAIERNYFAAPKEHVGSLPLRMSREKSALCQ